MTLEELKSWVNSLPEEFIKFSVVASEEGVFMKERTFRKDAPLQKLAVDEDSKEILLFTSR